MPIVNPSDQYNEEFFNDIITNGTTVYSSGTSGKPKELYQPPAKILAASQAAINLQGLTSKSKIYTPQRLTHVAGLFVNTIPGLIVGSDITLTHGEPFNPYKWVRVINHYTHCSLTPLHCKMIMATKGFDTMDLSGVMVVCGADPVTWDIIEAFVSRGCTFIANWGMSEIGPCTINQRFDTMEDVERVKAFAPSNSSIMGSVKYCDWKITDHTTLAVKGDISIYGDEWYDTNDRITVVNDTLFYTGRTNCYVNFNDPKKG